MKIRTFKTLEDDIFRVTIYTQDWSEGDTALITKFGEPEIDLGGSFTGPPLYTLPTNLVNIKSESPFNQSFDTSDFADAQDRADVWAAEIATRITTAVSTLRTDADDYTGESVVEV